ncbi:hypothetical protein BC476_06000 [Vibrio parahaemolyticus]|uniref:baseplate tail-tube junction protein n=1 Tax=Vibrio parahaemolyticus TaxID=670 RepID=UPI00083B8C82|nr:baseplate tail-tube junction protein [Vibrio parahaemolyticus]ODA49492.1 hypothetical protein BC476_06000 [Vibrio parahaemolyticus]
MSVEDVSSTKELMTSSDAEVQAKYLKYPLDVDERRTLNGLPVHAHKSFLVFTVAQPVMGQSTDSSLKKEQASILKSPAASKVEGHVALPLPNNMLDAISHDYANSETTIWNDLAASYVNAPGEGFSRISNAASSALPRVMERLSASTLNTTTVRQETGQLHNQRNTVLYQGTQLRTQTFQYSFRARSFAELKTIHSIIRFFQRYSLASRGKATVGDESYDTIGTIDAPPAFVINEVYDKQLKRVSTPFTFGPAVITNIRLNKTPNQQYQTISGTAGDPIEVDFEITFKEMLPMYRDFFDEIEASIE